MKFRKKPIVIDAVRYLGPNKDEVESFAGNLCRDPETDGLCIRTLEGTMVAIPGDWIIKGVKNEFYPCKPDIFEATYEAVEDSK